MKCDVKMTIVITADQRAKLEHLAQVQHRSMNDVLRLAIEAVYQRTMMQQSAGKAVGSSQATGRAP